MEKLSRENEEILQLFIITAACIGAILTSIFSLTHGIHEVFPFLYILPIILVVYFYPKRAVIFALGISLLYIGLVYLLLPFSPGQIAISTAWFAIYIVIGVVASSYANELQEEHRRIRSILRNSQDGIICLDLNTEKIREINSKCARWLRYDREDLLGKELSTIWAHEKERERFIADVKNKTRTGEIETLFYAKDGSPMRFVLSAVIVTGNRVLCSVIDITGSKIIDEEIRKTLDDLEDQVRQRTEHLEKINEELRAEILERRRREQEFYSGSVKDMEERDR